MKAIFTFLFVSLICTSAGAHDYFFAFAEVEYNLTTGKFEGTITVTTHDFENSMNGIRSKELPALETLKISDSLFSVYRNELKKKFKLNIQGATLPLEIVGHQVYMVGTTEFYFESDEVEFNSDFTCTFDLMMNSYQEQQNKLTFIYGSNKETYTFFYNKRSNTIKLESKNDD